MKTRRKSFNARRSGERSLAAPEKNGFGPFKRKYPIGAEAVKEGGTHFRVWAPRSKKVAVQIGASLRPLSNGADHFELVRESNGYFSGHVAEAKAGALYRFQLDTGAFPDPASRFQPEGPHGPSRIVDPTKFKWTDHKWKGVPRDEQVIYEMHIGTFTSEGTWQSAIEQLPELARLGITVVEVMPVADFSGRFGWGYDGVNLFAPTRLYGEPDDFRAFVNRAHELGVGVILDVVYNHFGPDGNYLKEYSCDYFTDRHQNEWGEAINFDDTNSGPVREFFITNAGYWIEEFHLDGLRLDATQQIFDDSKDNIIAALTREVRRAGNGRSTYIVSENEAQQVRLVKPVEQGGYATDALWNDDFHHSAMVALTGRNEAYYSGYQGRPQEFISAIKHGFLFQGQWYAWQKKRRGSASLGLHPHCFVNFIQNHDQVANSLHGVRLHQLTSPGRYKAMTALLLLGPATPMLFQGQEFAASNPFLYFADHNPELARLVAEGRRKFLEQFPSIACPESGCCLGDPESEESFQRCKLDFVEREKHAGYYHLHRDLLKLRRENSVFSSPRIGGVDGAVLASEAFVLRFFAEGGGDRLLIINLGIDLKLDSISEPVEKEGWHLPGHSAVVLGSRKLQEPA